MGDYNLTFAQGILTTSAAHDPRTIAGFNLGSNPNDNYDAIRSGNVTMMSYVGGIQGFLTRENLYIDPTNPADSLMLQAWTNTQVRIQFRFFGRQGCGLCKGLSGCWVGFTDPANQGAGGVYRLIQLYTLVMLIPVYTACNYCC